MQLTLFQTKNYIGLLRKAVGMCYDNYAFIHLVGALLQNVCDLSRRILVQIPGWLIGKDNASFRSLEVKFRFSFLKLYAFKIQVDISDILPLFEYPYRLKCLKCAVCSQSFYNLPTLKIMFQVLFQWCKT